MSHCLAMLRRPQEQPIAQEPPSCPLLADYELQAMDDMGAIADQFRVRGWSESKVGELVEIHFELRAK